MNVELYTIGEIVGRTERGLSTQGPPRRAAGRSAQGGAGRGETSGRTRMGVRHMARRIDVTGADGIGLAVWEFGGAYGEEGGEAGARDGGGASGVDARPAVVLLHGLMGRASTWAENTARWLAPRFRTLGLDQRGHGHSDKPEGPYTREAYVRDLEAVVERLDIAPAVLVGHSTGALTAWQLAVRRPDLVRALVIAEMRASAHGEPFMRRLEGWLGSWPVPFDSLGAARRWFAEGDPELETPRPGRGEYFAELMAEGEDGYRPGFSFAHILRSFEAWVHEAHWDELSQVGCPTLVVRGIDGLLGRAEAQEMVRVLPDGHYAEVPDAGHFVHVERPEGWREAVEPFLKDVVAAG